MNYTLYTVMPGNTLWGIANFFGTTVDNIVRENDIDNPEFIMPGIVLKIPATLPQSKPDVYIVRPKDTLWSIAKRYGVSVNDIMSYNNLANPNVIYPGQGLRLKP
ncbi:MAG: LysM peptidoglycan-binding domain-containing protein [Clostridia bacterium]|nr:LysM peptidoglycan-binding domain-containing protein [Clostridia bacterium]